MPLVEQLDSVSIERLRKQDELLLRIYQAEMAKDPASRATESSRSNVIAMQHTVRQMYGEAVARDVTTLSGQRWSLELPTNRQLRCSLQFRVLRLGFFQTSE
jgi:hypothetical protein